MPITPSIPEPETFALLGAGQAELAAIGFVRRRAKEIGQREASCPVATSMTAGWPGMDVVG